MMKTQTWKRGQHPTYIISCFSNDVWVRSEQPLTVPRSQPDLRLTPRAAEILGDNGVARFREFWSYQEGWDFGRGRPLTPPSVARLEAFFETYSFFPRPPSLFLNRNGYLMLGWEDAAGATIELEFAPQGYSLFLEAADAEYAFADEEIGDLLRLLPAAEAHGEG